MKEVKTLNEKVQLLCKHLQQKSIKYDGDMADFGNEVGFALGNVIENMNE